jgi:poly(3-hydroxybutyrate) depolymerase
MRWGIIYIPEACVQSPNDCILHVNYHGCTARDWPDREVWANTINLNEYAEANNMVILYPQSFGSKINGVGCWNWSDY